MEVYIVYRQWRETSWLGCESWGPREFVAVYGDRAAANETAERWSAGISIARYTFETKSVLYGHRLLKRELLGLLSDSGKRLIGLCE